MTVQGKVLTVLFLFGSFMATAQNYGLDSLSYYDFQKVLMRSTYQGEIKQSIDIVEQARNYYPEKEHELFYQLVILNLLNNDEEQALRSYSEAINKGMFLGITGEMIRLDSLSDFKTFDSLLSIDKKRLQERQASTKGEYLIYLPPSYQNDTLYPLFIVLHDWGQSAEELREIWQAPIMDNMIVVYAQSSKVADMDGYCWSDFASATEEINSIFKEIIQKYSVDTNQVVIGGYKQGGQLAVYLSMGQILPNIGFFVVNPMMPPNFTKENAMQFKTNEQKVVMVTGFLDPTYNEQIAMMNLFREIKVLYKYSPRKSLGSEFPKDFEDYLRRGLKYMGFKE